MKFLKEFPEACKCETVFYKGRVLRKPKCVRAGSIGEARDKLGGESGESGDHVLISRYAKDGEGKLVFCGSWNEKAEDFLFKSTSRN